MRTGAETLDNGETVDTFTTRRENTISSAFLNASYSYQNKYLANASYRRDGSSRFGENKKYGNFYAIGLGWNIHKEAFMVDNTLLNQLKLRVSYGINGNDQIDPFGYSGTFSGTGTYNGTNVATIASAGNASISWEKNATFDIGVDFSILNNRISGYIDYYNRRTSDLLYNLPVSSLNGDTFVFQNFGGMQNSGVEISLNTKNIVAENGFSWTTGINITTNNNKITELETIYREYSWFETTKTAIPVIQPTLFLNPPSLISIIDNQLCWYISQNNRTKTKRAVMQPIMTALTTLSVTRLWSCCALPSINAVLRNIMIKSIDNAVDVGIEKGPSDILSKVCPVS